MKAAPLLFLLAACGPSAGPGTSATTGTTWSGGAGGEGGSGPVGPGSGGWGGEATGGGGVGGSGDVTAPTVQVLSPADDVTAVGVGTTVAVTFSEGMNAATITTNIDGTCGGSVQVSTDDFGSCVPMAGAPTSDDDATFVLTPAAPLAASTSHRTRVTAGAEDLAGNALSGSFETPSGFTTRYFHTITVDGVNDFAPADDVASSTTGATLYVSFDETNLYLGLAHVDIVVGGAGNKWVYFLLSTDAALGTGNALSSDGKARFGAAGMLSHHWKERIDGVTFTEYRMADTGAWVDWGNANKAAFRAAGFIEGSIALSELGNPLQVNVTAYTVDYTGDGGNGWLYNMLAGATDGSGATPVDLTSYLALTLPTSDPASATSLASF